MIKTILALTLCNAFLFASVNDIQEKIDDNKKKYAKIKKNKESTSSNIEKLSSQIKAEDKYYKDITKKTDGINNELLLNRLKLAKTNEKLIRLKQNSVRLQKEKKVIENNVVELLIERYAMSMGVELSNQETLQEVVDKEVYTMILDNAKQEVLNLNIDYLKINRAIRKNEDSIKKLTSYVNNQEDIQKKYKRMKEKQEKILASLKDKHKKYQKYLQDVIDKQVEVKSLLGSLNILKKKEIAKEKERIRKAKELARKRAAAKKRREEKLAKEKEAKRQATLKAKLAKSMKKRKDLRLSKKSLDEDIDIEVRKLGSSAKGVKISKYNGKKTMAPLKSYTITKKFGKYYDEVYKMELFNESVSLKTKKPNAKVFSVLKGQIVYAKKNSGLLENVVIVKHSGNLHTIYSHLDKISPTLRVGKWIPKGYVVGRVNDTLLFQATKNSKYINPLKLFKR